jgi:hypothetical protein
MAYARIQMRLSPYEKRVLQELAQQNGMSLSNFVRQVINEAAADCRDRSSILKFRSVKSNGRTSSAETHLREQLEAEGCTVHTKGWPDFLVVYPNGCIKAIEVKSTSDVVRPHQQAIHKALRAAGVEVEVIYFDPEPEKCAPGSEPAL